MRYYYRNGDIPILILSLHGGKDKLKCFPRKNHKNIVIHMSKKKHKDTILVKKS